MRNEGRSGGRRRGKEEKKEEREGGEGRRRGKEEIEPILVLRPLGHDAYKCDDAVWCRCQVSAR